MDDTVSSVSCITEHLETSDISDNKCLTNDPAEIKQIISFSYELKKLILNNGPCQPTLREMKNYKFPMYNGRHFRPEWFTKRMQDGRLIKRDWLSYSMSEDKVYCIVCMLVGEKNSWTTNGFNSWKKATSKFLIHETSFEHIEASVQLKLMFECLPLLPALEESKKREVATNRLIVSHLIDITIYLARHCLAFRGHRENWKSSQNQVQGNFKDLIMLIAKYSPILASYINGIQSTKKKSQFTFVSWLRQNQLIEATAQYIRTQIVQQIKKGKFFSVSMDTTFDRSKKEQLSFVVRYINEDTGNVHERVLAMKQCSNTTAQYLLSIFENICEENELDWKTNLVGQSYDGASNMRGVYGGLQALIKSSNEAATYVWCYAHRLNLVLTDAVSCSTSARDMFGIVETIYEFISSSKNRVVLFERNQKKLNPDKQIRRFKRVETTRWWSHDLALRTVIFTFDALCDTLEEIENNNHSNDRKSSYQARSIYENIINDRFLLTAFTYTQIFDIISPLSTILQSKDLDLLGAIESVLFSVESLKKLRNEAGFLKITRLVFEFKENSLMCIDDFKGLTCPRKRRVPCMAGEHAVDERIDDPLENFKINTYFVAIDIAVNQIQERFSDISTGICRDLSLFSRRRLNEVSKDSTKLPADAFQIFASVYKKFVNKNDLQREYVQFSKYYFKFESNKYLPLKLHKVNCNSETDVFFENNSDSTDSEKLECQSLNELDEQETKLPNNSNSMTTVLQVLRISGLSTIFPTLYTALKIGVVLPVASATTERCFSKLDIVKNKLRSTMTEERLDSLIIISSESDIDINTDCIIDLFAKNSSFLMKALER